MKRGKQPAASPGLAPVLTRLAQSQLADLAEKLAEVDALLQEAEPMQRVILAAQVHGSLSFLDGFLAALKTTGQRSPCSGG